MTPAEKRARRAALAGVRAVMKVEGALAAVPLHGVRVTRVRNAIFIPLPRVLWRRINDAQGKPSPCRCGNCSGVAYWDTLAVSTRKNDDYTWAIHAPELHTPNPENYV